MNDCNERDTRYEVLQPTVQDQSDGGVVSCVVADWTSKPLRPLEVRLKTKCLKFQRSNNRCSRPGALYLPSIPTVLYSHEHKERDPVNLMESLQLAKGLRGTRTLR